MYENMHPTIKLFLILYLSHLIADFPLQVPWIARNKGRKAWAIIIHAFVHYGTAALLLAVFATSYLPSWRTNGVLAILILSHVALDAAKFWLTTNILPDSSVLFLLDQFAHLGMIAVVSLYLSNTRVVDVLQLSAIPDHATRLILVVGIVYVIVVFAGGYLIRYLTKSLARGVPPTTETREELANAGLYIGWLERFLVLTAITIQSPTMVGLILTGKSIARFPELKEPRFAEYFLIGTLLSISIAVLGGLILAHMIWGTSSLK